MKNWMRVLCVLICCAMLALCSCERGEVEEPKTQAKTFYEFFDTECAVFSYLGDTEAFESNANYVRERLQMYHRYFDIYFGYSGLTNVYTLNRKAKDGPIAVSDELFDFLLHAKEMYTLTNGAVNIAMGAVLIPWHNVREQIDEDPSLAVLPTEEELQEANLHTNIEDLILDEENKTVYYRDPKLKLDVGALAKGYACEKIAEELVARGITSYVLNFGGNIRTIGTKVTGAGWVTGITNPKRGEDPFLVRVELKNTSLVTSGDYQRYFVYDSVKYHHIIDPDTLYPSRYFTSVSILTEDSGLGDALSTALFCMPREEGLLLLDKLRENGMRADVLWVDTEGNTYMTDGFSAIVYTES